MYNTKNSVNGKVTPVKTNAKNIFTHLTYLTRTIEVEISPINNNHKSNKQKRCK